MAAAAAGGRVSHGAVTNLLSVHTSSRNADATVFCGNLSPQVDEEILWVRICVTFYNIILARIDLSCKRRGHSLCARLRVASARRRSSDPLLPSCTLSRQELFQQIAPVVSVYMPKDRVHNKSNGFAFVELKTEVDAEYAVKVRS